jgi:hypothetical protein
MKSWANPFPCAGRRTRLSDVESVFVIRYSAGPRKIFPKDIAFRSLAAARQLLSAHILLLNSAIARDRRRAGFDFTAQRMADTELCATSCLRARRVVVLSKGETVRCLGGLPGGGCVEGWGLLKVSFARKASTPEYAGALGAASAKPNLQGLIIYVMFHSIIGRGKT